MAPWPSLAPFGRRALLASGQELFFFEAGDPAAPALLLIHGLGDEADTWRHVFGPLSERWHVIAPDLPGFGRSGPARRYSLPGVRDALLGLLDALHLPAASLMGSSLGAAAAQTMALKAPGRVESLFLVDGTLTVRGGSLNWGLLLMALPITGDRIYTGFRRNPQAAHDSLRPYYADLAALPEADRQFLFQRVNERVWSDTQRRAYLGLLQDVVWSAPRRQRALLPALAGLHVPTHLIWGEHDRIVPIESARALMTQQPQARLTVLPGAGHLPHQDQPAAFLEAVLAAQPMPGSRQGATDAV